jgi:hypothetical protein
MWQMIPGQPRIKGGCDLTRGTRGEVHPHPAFKVAHLAAEGMFFTERSPWRAGFYFTGRKF